MIRRPPSSTLFPYTTFFPSWTMGYLAANVVTTTDYNYGSGIYLLNSAVGRGKQADNFDATVKIQSDKQTAGPPGHNDTVSHLLPADNIVISPATTWSLVTYV